MIMAALTDELGLAVISDAGIILGTLMALIVLAWTLKPVFLRALDIRSEHLKGVRENEQGHIQVERDHVSTLEAIGKRLEEDTKARQAEREQEERSRSAERQAIDSLATAVQMLNQTSQAQAKTFLEAQQQMSAAATERAKWQDRALADIQMVPAETERLFKPLFAAQADAIKQVLESGAEQHVEVIREAVNAALKPILSDLEEKLNQMPGTEVTRRLMRDEVEKLHQRLIDQVAAQTSTVLDKLNEIVTALDKLQPPTQVQKPLSEDGEKPSDETPEDKEYVESAP